MKLHNDGGASNAEDSTSSRRTTHGNDCHAPQDLQLMAARVEGPEHDQSGALKRTEDALRAVATCLERVATAYLASVRPGTR